MLLVGCLFKNLALVPRKYVFQTLIATAASRMKPRARIFFDSEAIKVEFTKETEDHPVIL